MELDMKNIFLLIILFALASCNTSEVKRAYIQSDIYNLNPSSISHLKSLSNKSEVGDSNFTKQINSRKYLRNYLGKKQTYKSMFGAYPLACSYRYYYATNYSLSSSLERAKLGCEKGMKNFNANFNADCKCRVIAVSNTFLYDETAYLGGRGIMPFNAQISQNGKISRIKGTYIADNPGQNKKMDTFKIKNDTDAQVCTGRYYVGKNKTKGKMYLNCFNGKVVGNGTYINAGYDSKLKMMSGTAEIQLDGGGIVRAIYGPEAR
jgi:hypothetical protein